MCGYDVERANQRREAKTLKEARAQIKVAKDAGCGAIVFDDFSFLAEATFADLEKKFSGFRLFGELRDEVIEFRNDARYSGIHVIVNAWERGPTMKEGQIVRGGPLLPGKLPESVPAMCDLVLRCGQDPMRKPFPGVYRCVPADPQWVMKDRFNVVPHVAPMNLGEILRAAGFKIPRHPALPWQEEYVEKIANALMAAPEAQRGEIGRASVAALNEKGIAEPYVRWTIRDAVDRVALRTARQANRDNLAASFGW
jgi:hypothetical protein